MVEIAITVVLVVVAYIAGRDAGIKEGKRLERSYCERVLIRSLYVRHSPTTKEILACVAGEQTEEQMETALENINKAVDRMNWSGSSADRKKEKADGR